MVICTCPDHKSSGSECEKCYPESYVVNMTNQYQRRDLNLFNKLGHQYSIDTNGIVHNNTTGKSYAGALRNGGYRFFTIFPKTYRVHRLVALAFIPNPEKKMEINHIDGCKDNNSVNNLEWSTHKENVQHASKNGLLKPAVGINHGSCILNEDEVRWICERLTNGEGYKAKDFPPHIGRHIVSKIRTRRAWTHISKDFAW